MERTIRILSLDGGGIRGLIPALVLDALEKRAKRPIGELFDLIAGTSTGAILALGLTLADARGKPRYSARDLFDLYIERGNEIFSRSLWKRMSSVEGLTDERYPSSGIEGVLKRYFGDALLKDTLVDVLIAAYELERRQPFLFRTRYARQPPRPNERFDYPIWQVARSSSAAPTYFEPYHLPGEDSSYYTLVDGGVYANNPAMCALVEAKVLYPDARIQMVSIGTGGLCRPITYDRAKNWGLVGWARPILDVVFDGVSDTVDFQAGQLLGPDFYRFQARLDDGSDDLDDASASNLDALIRHARQLLLDSASQLDAVARIFSATSA
ncbi:MAG TPA: patatin-like phospholipase family protein [Polyangiaceae bacterium]